MYDQVIVFGVLGVTLALFIHGRWRYDIVALGALLSLAVLDIVPGNEAFLGFGSPAVVTVAAVLVVSRALRNSGLVDLLARWLQRIGNRPALQVGAMTLLVTVCSSFMNNVGALALLMPVALTISRQYNISPSAILMPMAFGSILGGMTTLIGTPANIIIAEFRGAETGDPFGMFDFSPVGVSVALTGVVFITFIGRRFLPDRRGQRSQQELFEIEDYISEVRIRESSPLAEKSLRRIGAISEADIVVLGIIRHEHREMMPSPFALLEVGDILIVESSPEDLKIFVQDAKLELVGGEKEEIERDVRDVGLSEAIVLPNSAYIGWTARSLELRHRYGINLLAIARKGERLKRRLGRIRFAAGDVVLIQGGQERIQEAVSALGWLPLAERGLRVGEPRNVAKAVFIFGVAIAATATGFVPASIAFVGAALAMRIFGFLSLREIYEAIDWPIVVLLGALIPVGRAMETTGGAQTLADLLLQLGGGAPPWLSLAVLLVGAMTLSDIINNAAAAVLMAPIAVRVAEGLEVSPDPFLIAVAVGCSCAFLTPIGHQSNTLVMEPAGYKFGDYARMGLPLEILVVAVSIPLTLYFWPF